MKSFKFRIALSFLVFVGVLTQLPSSSLALGNLSISANIDDVVDFYVRNGSVWVVPVQGNPYVYYLRSYGILSPYDFNLQARVTSDGYKKPRVQILQRPSYYNGYTLHLRVWEPTPSRHNVNIEIWGY